MGDEMSLDKTLTHQEQEASIKMLHKNLHDYAAEIVRLRSQIRAAWSALQAKNVAAAIAILEKCDERTS